MRGLFIPSREWEWIEDPPSGCPGLPPALPELGKVSSDTLHICRGKAWELGFPYSFGAVWGQATAVVCDLLGETCGANTGVRRVRHFLQVQNLRGPKIVSNQDQ